MHIRKIFTLVAAAAFIAAPALAKDKDGEAAPAEATWGTYDESGNYDWPSQAEVTDYFHQAYAIKCQTEVQTYDPELAAPQVYELDFSYSWDDAETPKTKYKLHAFACSGGAYNFSTVYLSVTEGEGIQPVAFTEPAYDIKYVDDNSEGAVESLNVTGFFATDMMTNSDFDAETNQLTSFSKWRGVGDASSTGLYQFQEGRFVLKQFDVDASYDGEINPQTIVDYTN